MIGWKPRRERARTALVLALLLSGGSTALVAQVRTVSLSGTVMDSTSGRPISGVSVLHGDSVIGTTDDVGRFTTPRLQVVNGAVRLSLRRIGYDPLEFLIQIPAGAETIDATVYLQQWPTTLDEIVVEGQRIPIRNPGLIGFYRRRADDFGRYLTEQEIQRAMAFSLARYMQRLRVDQGSGDCSPFRPLVYYLDGIRMEYDHINRILPPRQVGGIEVYMDERSVRLPSELIPAGPYCGVVLFWSLDPPPPSSVEIAGYYTYWTGINHTSLGLLGGQVAFPLRSWSTLRFVSGIDFPVGQGEENWYASLLATLQPLGSAFPWYAGTGVALVKRDGERNQLYEPISIRHIIVTGVRLSWRALRPFTEVRVLNAFRPSTANVLFTSGIGVHLGQ